MEPNVARCLAASEQATTLRREHKLNDARGALLVCADEGCPTDIRNECTQTLSSVVAALPTIVFAPTDADGKDVVEVQVTMDGKPFVDHCDGKAIPLDPGEHDFTFTDLKGATVQRHLVVHEGEKSRREAISFGTPITRLSAHASSTWGRLAIGLGGVGALGLIAGAAAGGVASGEWADAKRDCGRACPAGSVAQSERTTAVTWADVSTGAFIGGGALLAAGALVWLTAPHETDAPASAAPVVGVMLFPVLGPNAVGASARVTFP
jgi:hypothetical protein